MYSNRNQINAKAYHSAKRSSSCASHHYNASPVKTMPSSPQVELKSLKSEREKRKILTTLITPNTLFFSSNIESHLSESTEQMQSLLKKWEGIKKTLLDSNFKNRLYSSNINLIKNISKANTQLTQSFKGNLPVKEEMPITLCNDENEKTEIQQVKQFNVKENYMQKQKKDVPITTINLEVEKTLKSTSNSEQKSSENSTAEKTERPSYMSKIRNRSYEPKERAKKQLSTPRSAINMKSPIGKSREIKKCESIKRLNYISSDVVKISLSKVDFNANPHQKMKELLERRVKSRISNHK